MFFCKYNDPPYLKLAKLEIMVRIANEHNIDQLLAELKEYAMEVDVDFVKRAIKAIGQVAIKIEEASEKAINVLVDLISTKVAYAVQEVVVVIKDIFRRYSGYEGIIATLCQCIDDLDDPNARGSLIWIVGEYAEKISNSGEILSGFVDGFSEEFVQVGVNTQIYGQSTANFTPDTIADPDSCGEAALEATSQSTRFDSKGVPGRDGRVRQPRYSRSSICLLATVVQ